MIRPTEPRIEETPRTNDGSDRRSLTRKFQFLVLTFGLSGAMVAAMSVAGTSRTEAGREPRAAVRQAPAASTEAADVVPAQRSQEKEIPVPPSARRGPESLYLPNIADIVERANPAVVNIRATEIIRSGQHKRRSSPHDPFEFFFPRPDGRDPRERGDDDDGDQRQDSGGSGFVVSEDGYILTNFHVIEEADRIVIRLADDSTEYQARVIGTDQPTDLALLKIEPRKRLTSIALGDSERLRVGEWVIAIGNPLIYEHTVTVGVVSAKGRKLGGLSRDVALDNYIQTDAAINRGNSGGPLLNVRGEAIGINSAISVAGQGISFAIPINMARDVMQQLREKGKVSRGFLGVTIQDIQTELKSDDREYFALSDRKGAFIQSVTQGQPAAVAGLKRGDAIVEVDGKPIDSSDDLIRTISAKPPGAKVALGIVREGKDRRLMAELTSRPDLAPAAEQGEDESTPDQPASDKRLGITVEELTASDRQELKLAPDITGVIVTKVSQVSEAWEHNLRENDIITEVNRKPVSTIAEYRAIVGKLGPGDILALYVVSPGVNAGRFITLRVGEE